MQQLIVATRNRNKTCEIQRILGANFAVRDLSDHPGIPETAESRETFQENAVLKAINTSRQLPGLVIADDSGLEVDALGGGPGIYSARYAGKNATDKENIEKLLSELAQAGAKTDQRKARFRCVIALARDDKLLGIFEGAVEGTIVDRPRGAHGFGYDPIFVPKGFGHTFAELPAEVKNRISHRAQAIRFLRAELVAPQAGS